MAYSEEDKKRIRERNKARQGVSSRGYTDQEKLKVIARNKPVSALGYSEGSPTPKPPVSPQYSLGADAPLPAKQVMREQVKRLATQKPDKDTEDVWAKKFAGFREGATLRQTPKRQELKGGRGISDAEFAQKFPELSKAGYTAESAYQEFGKGAKPFLERYVGSATLGAGDIIGGAKRGAEIQKFQQRYPGSTTGMIAGYFGPGALFSKGAGAITKASAKSGVKKLAATEALAGGTMELAEGLVRQESLNDTAKRVLYGTVGGGAGGALFGGAGKLYRKGMSQVDEALESPFRGMGDIDPIQRPTRPITPTTKPVQPRTLPKPLEVPQAQIEAPAPTTLTPYEQNIVNDLKSSGVYNKQDIDSTIQSLESNIKNIENKYTDELFASGKQGVQQGGIVRDEYGGVTGRFGRTSNNPKWYREAYAEYGGVPSKKFVKKKAIKQLEEGWVDDTFRVQPNTEYVESKNLLESYKNIRKSLPLEAPAPRLTSVAADIQTPTPKIETPTPVEPTPTVKPKPPVEAPMPKAEKPIPKVEPKIAQYKSVADLPDDVDALAKVVGDMEEAQKKGIPLDLQMFAEAKKKLTKMSKHYKNLNRVLDPEDYKKLDPMDFEYTVKGERESVEEALSNIAKKSEDKVIDELYNVDAYTGVQTDESMTLAKELQDQGKWDESVRLRMNTAEKVREGGRSIQALKKHYKTPEGRVQQNIKDISTVQEDILKNADKKASLEDKSNKVKKVMDDARKKAEDDLIKETKGTVVDNQNDLASKIIKDVQTRISPPKEKQVLNEMVNELFRKAKATMPKKETLKANPIKKLGDMVRNRQVSYDMWKEAQDIVLNKFKGNQEALDILEKYGVTSSRPPFATQTLDASVNKALADLGITIEDIVKNYYRTGRVKKNSLVNYIKDVSGATDADAKLIANYVEKNLKQRIREYANKQLDNLAKEIKVKKVKTQADRLQDVEGLLNIQKFSKGDYFDNPEIVARFQGKLDNKIKDIIRNSDIKMNDLVKLGTDITEGEKTQLMMELKRKLKLNDSQMQQVMSSINSTFNEMAKKSRRGLLTPKLKPREKVVSKPFVQKMREIIDLDAYNDEAMLNLIKENEKIPTLSGEEAQTLTRMYEQMDRLDPTSWEYRAAMSRVENILASKQIPTLGEKIKTLRLIGMLGSFKTMISRNMGGNALMMALKNFKDVVGAGVDVGVSKALGTDRTKYLPNFKEQWEGFGTGLKETIKDIKYGVDTSPSRTMYDLPAAPTFKGKVLGTAERVVSKGLEFGDRPFYEAAKNEALYQLNKRGIDPTKLTDDEMFELVTNEALKSTYQDMNKLAKMFGKIKDGLNEMGPKGLGLGDIAQPFYKTISGITTRAWDYSLGSVVDALQQSVKLVGGKQTFDQRQFVDAIARGTTGAGLIKLGYELAENDFITGGQSTSVKDNIVDHLQGKQTFSFNVGDKYYSFDWAQPASLPLAIGAGLYKSGKDSDSMKEFIGEAIKTSGETLLENSALKGYDEAFRGYGSFAEKGKKFLERQTSSFVPFSSSLRQTRDLADPFYRQKDYTSPVEQVKDIIPFMSKTLPKKYDVLGDPIRKYGGDNTMFNVLFNPARVSKSKLDEPVVKEIKRLHDLGFNEHIPPKVGKTINAYNPETKRLDKVVKLNSEAISELQKLQGQGIKEGITQALQSERYKNAKDEKTRAKILSNIISDEKEDAMEEYLQSKGMTRKK